MTGLAGPDYDATISFGLPFEPEDSPIWGIPVDVVLSNRDEDTLLSRPDCSENLIVLDGNGTYYGASNCEFSGNIRDGKIPYQESSGKASVGIALEYELPESASDLELLAEFELDEEEGRAEGFIIRLSDIKR